MSFLDDMMTLVVAFGLFGCMFYYISQADFPKAILYLALFGIYLRIMSYDR